MPGPVTDPALLAQLNDDGNNQPQGGQRVTDPQLIQQLESGNNNAPVTDTSDNTPAVVGHGNDAAPQTFDAGQSAAYGFGTGATFGLLDEAGGAVDSVLPSWATGDGPRNNIWNSNKGIGDLYTENRDKNRAILDTAREDNPNAYLGGDVASALIPVGGALHGAQDLGMLARVGKQAKLGAAMGAARGFGDGNGLVDSLENSAIGTAVGAGVGGVLGAGSAVAHGVGDAGKYVGDTMRDGYKWLGNNALPIASQFLPHANMAVRSASRMGEDAIGEAVDAVTNNPVAATLMDNPVTNFVRNYTGGLKASLARETVGHFTGHVPEMIEGGARAAQAAGRLGAYAASTPASVKASINSLAEQESNQKDHVSTALQDPDKVIQMAQGTPFQQVLQNAAAKGRQSFLATLYVLRTNPDFRRMVQSKAQ